jgi:hypothetical protein
MEMYHFRTEWPVTASVDRAWEAIVEAERWSDWGKGFRRVAVKGPESRLSPGAIADAEIRGTLPFTLRFTFQVDRFEPPRVLSISAFGDVVGEGRWEIEDVPGGGANVAFYWDVGLANRFLDALGRLPMTKRLMGWNHDVVMADAYQGFRSQVEAHGHPSQA